ncbi:MAG: FecR family protein, partial [Rhodospirillales bacterium]|nr:FecR family protein [Rhodospirillales bacterium]
MKNAGSRDADSSRSLAADGGGIQVLQAVPGEPLVVAAEAWLLKADFVRSGPDLLLIGADGSKILVRDFFNLENPPDLMTGSGAVVSAELAAKLAGPAAPGQYAQAADVAGAEPIGTIETVKGRVEVTRADGTKVTVQKGDAVFQGDVVETGEDASIGIILADNSVFSLDQGGRLVLDEMVYDPGTQTGAMGVSLMTGVMSFVSGEIAKVDPDAMTVNTPVATIGIRGTSGSVSGGDTMTVVLTGDIDGTTGEITVATPAGGVQVLSTAFQAVQVAADGQMSTFAMSEDQYLETFGGSIEALQEAMVSGGQDTLTGGDGDDDLSGGAGPDLVEAPIEGPSEGFGPPPLPPPFVPPPLPPLPPPFFTPMPIPIPDPTSFDIPDYSAEANTILAIVQKASLAAKTAGNAEDSAAAQVGTISGNLGQQATAAGLSSAETTTLASVITGPLNALGSAGALSATSTNVAKAALALLATVGTATPPDAAVIANLLAAALATTGSGAAAATTPSTAATTAPRATPSPTSTPMAPSPWTSAFRTARHPSRSAAAWATTFSSASRTSKART